MNSCLIAKQRNKQFQRNSGAARIVEMDVFEIKPLPGKGLGMVAKKDIQAGETILEEEPFVSHQFSWNALYGYLACDHCMRPLETTLENVKRLTNETVQDLPLQQHDPTKLWEQQFTICARCKVRYCSEDCRMAAYQRYHKAGCLGVLRVDENHPINVLNDIWKSMHYPPETGTIMLLVRLMLIYKQSADKQKFLQQLESFQSSAINAEKEIYHKMLGSNFQEQMSQLYKAFCNAFADEEFAAFTTPNGFKTLLAIMGTNCQGVATSVLSEWVKKVSDLPMSEEDKEKLDQFIDELYDKLTAFAGEFLNVEGSGLYLNQSKVNHSCVPNAESTFPYSNDIVVLKATHPISAGSEICISYLEECQLERSRHTRHKILKENYVFICECPKCQAQANDADETSSDEDDEMDMDEDNMEE